MSIFKLKRIKSKLLSDILRDKGSTKYSITKTLALIFSFYLIAYLVASFIKDFDSTTSTIDHTLIIELIGLIAGLVGLKNNWGIGNTSKENNSAEQKNDTKIEGKKNDINENELNF